MDPVAHETPEALIDRARRGSEDGLGQLLERYRNYLRFLVRLQLHGALRTKVDPSDLAQETVVDAFRDFGGFRGTTEAELVAWLRRILAHNLADQVRRHTAEKRRLDRQQSLEAMLERSSNAFAGALAGDVSTPSARASRREQAVLLADALERLPARYRDVIVLRHFEHLRFNEIAARTGGSSGAARMAWARAIEKLQQLVDEDR